MHYSIQRPEDAAAASILDAVLTSISDDKRMQADLIRLDRACCTPGKFVALEGVPIPASVLS